MLEGNYYGTPKPLNNNYILAKNEDITNDFKSLCLPGLHPRSEGKRKRNRSNVEAMAGKNLSHDSIIGNQDSRKGTFLLVEWYDRVLVCVFKIDSIFH